MHKVWMLLLAVALLALLATPLMAQTARTTAMGGGLSAAPDDETSHMTNPAGLPYLSTFGMDLSPWPTRASATVAIDSPSGTDYFAGSLAARDEAQVSGWGASYQNDGPLGDNAFAVGYGRQLGPAGFSGGISLTHATNGSDTTMFGFGLMYRHELPLQTWRVGLMVNDLADEAKAGGPRFDLGAAVQLPEGVLAAATIFDITDEIDTQVGVGLEWPIPMSPVTLRGGLYDSDLSLGAGYRWNNFDLSLSWTDADGGDFTLLSATGCF